MHGQVAHEIGRRIVSGAIAEGEFLPRESQLSEEFAVSRQAVREALKVLAAKGLISSRRRAGTVVMPRSSWNLLDPDVLAWHPPAELIPEFLSDLVELRRLIEPAAAQFAATRGEPDKIERIGAALKAMQQNIKDLPAYNAADTEFHLAVFSACGNTLIERLSTILAPLLEASFRLQSSVGGEPETAVLIHQAVFDAIASHDAARAGKAMESILSHASSEITAVMLEDLQRQVRRSTQPDSD